MIFQTANPFDLLNIDPHPLIRVKVGGVPEFPVHHVLTPRERNIEVLWSDFTDWLKLNEMEVVEFYNDNPNVQQQIVLMFEEGKMSYQEVLDWVQSNTRDSTTPSDISYGFENENDYMAFKMRWL